MKVKQMMNDKELIVGRILAKIQLYRLMHTMCLSFQVTLRIKKAASKKLIHVSAAAAAAAAAATAVEIDSSVVIYPSLIQGLKVVRVLAYNPHHHHHRHNHEYHDQNRNHFEQQHDDNNNDNDPMYQSTGTHITQLVQLR